MPAKDTDMVGPRLFTAWVPPRTFLSSDGVSKDLGTSSLSYGTGSMDRVRSSEFPVTCLFSVGRVPVVRVPVDRVPVTCRVAVPTCSSGPARGLRWEMAKPSLKTARSNYA